MVSRGQDSGSGRDLPARPKFPLGRIVQTPAARSEIPAAEIAEAVQRHARGDWGEFNLDEHRANDLSVDDGGQILSAYVASNLKEFWVLTRPDRSATIVMLPGEYLEQTR